MTDNKFTYNYSPARTDEAERIASKYIDAGNDADSDLERLKKLDRRAEFPGTFSGIAVGIAGVLIMGTGLSLVLSFDHFAAGVVIGIAGLVIAAAALPVSRAVTLYSRKKYRDEILALSEKIKNGK